MNFGRKNVYFLILVKKPEIDADAEILQRIVDETGVTGLVAAHEGEEVAHVFVLGALLHFGVEHAARKFGRDRADEKVAELLVEVRRQIREVGVEFLSSNEVLFVWIGAHLRDQRVPLRAHRR